MTQADPGPDRRSILQSLREKLTPMNLYAGVSTLAVIFLVAHPWLRRTSNDSALVEGPRIRDLVRQVKQELSEADSIAQARHELALFELKEFDLDISFVVQSKQTAGGKAGYELLAVESNSEIATARTQRIHLHWTTVGSVATQLKPNPGLEGSDAEVVGQRPPPKGDRP